MRWWEFFWIRIAKYCPNKYLDKKKQLPGGSFLCFCNDYSRSCSNFKIKLFTGTSVKIWLLPFFGLKKLYTWTHLNRLKLFREIYRYVADLQFPDLWETALLCVKELFSKSEGHEFVKTTRGTYSELITPGRTSTLTLVNITAGIWPMIYVHTPQPTSNLNRRSPAEKAT